MSQEHTHQRQVFELAQVFRLAELSVFTRPTGSQLTLALRQPDACLVCGDQGRHARDVETLRYLNRPLDRRPCPGVVSQCLSDPRQQRVTDTKTVRRPALDQQIQALRCVPFRRWQVVLLVQDFAQFQSRETGHRCARTINDRHFHRLLAGLESLAQLPLSNLHFGQVADQGHRDKAKICRPRCRNCLRERPACLRHIAGTEVSQAKNG